MTLNPIEILSKPKLEVSGFDELVMCVEVALVILLVAAIGATIQVMWENRKK